MSAALKKEASVLKELCDSADADDDIPKLISFGKLNVELGGVGVALPAITLEPLGIRADVALSRVFGNQRDKLLVGIGEDVRRALGFVHKKGFIHNDVAPKNIIYDEDKKQAFLIDFGLPSKAGEKVGGFRGTVLYVHRFIFAQYPGEKWTPETDHDLASLAFSIAVLSNGGKCPWKYVKPYDKDVDYFDRWAKERSDMTKEHLQNGGFTDTPWLKWAAYM